MFEFEFVFQVQPFDIHFQAALNRRWRFSLQSIALCCTVVPSTPVTPHVLLPLPSLTVAIVPFNYSIVLHSLR